MKKTILIGLIAIAIVAFVFLYTRQPQQYVGPVDKVTVGVETSLLTAAVWVAEHKGFFAEEGLDLTIEESGGS